MSLVSQVIRVGIADLKLARSPDLLRTSGLGSCVGVVIYDSTFKLAGMAHVMLPDSHLNKNAAQNRWKFADTAIDDLYKLLIENGARKHALKAKIAGGAQMFAFNSGTDKVSIGNRNVEAVMQGLKKYRVPLTGRDTGGNSGRTIEFHPASGVLKIKTIHKGESEI